MKTLISILLFFLLAVSVVAQQKGAQEIFLSVSGVSSQETITFTFDAIGTVWDEDDITTSYDQAQEVTTGNVDGNNTGWDIAWSELSYEAYAHGLYKLSTNYDGGFVYIDFRDSKYANNEYSGGGAYGADINIHYYGSSDEFGLKAPADSAYDIVDNQSLNRIWDIKNNGTAPVTSTFEDFWDYCLGMTYNLNGNPRIVWGPHPSFSPISGYKIYRATLDADSTGPPDPGDYSLEATVNSSTYSYLDGDVKLDENGDYFMYYYVKAYYEHPRTHNITYSSATNTIYTDYVEFYKSIGERKKVISKYPPKLHQNYPNPFNPMTTISFDLPKESNVQIQIFDILGKVVSTLINKEMGAGSHSIGFTSSGLTSGVYFYRLQTNEFTDIKRMLILK